jgi:hypothetical protein
MHGDCARLGGAGKPIRLAERRRQEIPDGLPRSNLAAKLRGGAGRTVHSVRWDGGETCLRQLR